MNRYTVVAQAIRRRNPRDVFRLVSELPQFVRLYLALLRDGGVRAWPKLLLAAATVYCFSPLDFLPDMFPVLGQIDDFTLFALAARAFLKACPTDLVRRHVAAIDPRGRWQPFEQTGAEIPG